MALLSTPSGISYCIDTTEVTQGQYAEFVAAYVPPTEQVHDLCPEPNTVLEPLDGQGQFCPPGSYAPDETPERAVDCITFCDAVSYCHWAGKRVCGVLGRAGETLGSWMDPESDFNLAVTDPERSQWYNACSSGGTNTYAYGETYDPACEGLADVGTRESCSTPGEQEVFDLSGNVEEWEDLCSSEGTCQRRGGYAGSAEATTCGDDVAASSASIPRARGGFRCCYEF